LTFNSGVDLTRTESELLVTVRTRTEAHSWRSQLWIGSESDCLLGQYNIYEITDSYLGLKIGNWDVTGWEGE